MKTARAIRVSHWFLVVARSVHWMRRNQPELASALNPRRTANGEQPNTNG
jgi:hypothetical protein